MHVYRKYETFADDVKDGVQATLAFYRDIWCGGSVAHYEHLVSWISTVCKGKKNSSFCYLKGPQGNGKSRGTDFLHEHVVGDQLYLDSKSEPLKSRFNKILFGKLLVTFEELEKSSENEWETINANLKRLATSNQAVYEEKNEKAFTSDNIINMIVNSNRDAVKDADGRRVFILPVSSCKKNDYEYWKKLTQTCFNNAVGHAFYCRMLEHDTENYNSQAFPESTIKDEINIDRLHNVFKFIKFAFIYKQKDLSMTVKELYDAYLDYCYVTAKVEEKYMVKKSQMLAKLREVDINYKSSNGKTVFRCPHETLMKIAKTWNWLSIHDQDEINDEDDAHAFLRINQKVGEVKEEADELKEQILKLQQKLKVVENKQEIQRCKKITTKTDVSFDMLMLKNRQMNEKEAKLTKEGNEIIAKMDEIFEQRRWTRKPIGAKTGKILSKYSETISDLFPISF